MSGFRPRMDICVDEATGMIRAAHIQVRPGDVHETREIASGRVFANYGEDGQLLGVELRAPCGMGVLDRIAGNEPDCIRRFLRGSPPRELVSV